MDIEETEQEQELTEQELNEHERDTEATRTPPVHCRSPLLFWSIPPR
jgi:hypothetical protein